MRQILIQSMLCCIFVINLNVIAEETIPQAVQASMTTASGMAKEGNYGGAIAEYQKVIDGFPLSMYALRSQKMIAISYIHSGNTSAADAATSKLNLYSNNTEAMIQSFRDIASTWRTKKNAAKALTINQALLLKYKSSPQAMGIQGAIVKCYRELADLSKADEAFDNLLMNYKENTNYIEFVFDLTAAYRNQKNYDKALSTYTLLKQTDPNNALVPEVQAAIVNTLLLKGDNAAAESELALLKKNYSAFPNYTDAICNVAVFGYRQIKQPVKAIELYNYLLQNCTDMKKLANVEKSLIKTYLSMDDVGQADNEFEIFWNKYKGSQGFVQVADKIKIAYQTSNKLVRCIQINKRLISEFPRHPLAIYFQKNNVSSYLRLNDFTSANKELELLWSNYPLSEENIELILNLQKEYRNHGKSEEGLQIYQKLISAFPSHEQSPIFLQGMVCSNLDLGNTAAASEGIERLLTTYGANVKTPECAKAIVSRMVKLKKWDQATELCGRLISLYPQNKIIPAVLKQLTVAHLQLNDQISAQASLEQLLTTYASYPDSMAETIKVAKKFCSKYTDYSKAIEIYSRLREKQTNPDNMIQIDGCLAETYIRMNSKQSADEKISYIQSSYAANPSVSKMIDHLANVYRTESYFADSLRLYEYALSKAQNPDDRINAYAGIAKAKVRLDTMQSDPNNSNTEVSTILQALMTDYKDCKRLGYHVFQIGEEYYFRAQAAQQKKNSEQARADFLKAVAVWENNINQIADPHHKCLAYYHSGIVYQEMKDYSKAVQYFEKVINQWPRYDRKWHALSSLALLYEDMHRENVLSKEAATKKIRSVYETLVKESPNCPAARRATSWLGRNGA